MDREKVFEAFRNCITEPKCRDCPWEQCEQFNQKKVEIPVTLALDVINLLKEQEAVKPKTGHWNGSECSNCHATFVRSVFDKPEYCSHCGAKMEDC